MDDPEVIAAEPLAFVRGLAVVRWRDATLPAGLSALIAEAEASGVDWITDFPADWLRRPFLAEGEALFLALDGDMPVAMAAISVDPHTDQRDVGRLRYIYVAEVARGCGLLRVFVEASLARASGRWRRLRLHTDNPVAARVYEAYGFAATRGEGRSTHVRDGL